MMTLLILVLRSAVVVVLSVMACGCVPKEPSITVGQGRLGVVRFDKGFLIMDVRFAKDPSYGGSYVTNLDYAVRKVPGELLFAMNDFDATSNREVYSDTVYAVKVDGSFKVRFATKQEWERAEQVLNTDSDEYRHTNEAHKRARETPQGVRYERRSFAMSGRTFHSMMFSPSAKWLAVFSHTSRKPLFSFEWPPGIGGAQVW